MRYLIASLFIHGLVFIFSGTTFIQHAQYSVQSSVQRVEVSIADSSVIARSEATKQSFKKEYLVVKKQLSFTNTQQPNKAIGPFPKSGVKVKANPDYFQNPSPEYPELAKQMRQEGLVMLSVDVDKSGGPIRVDIIQGSGFRLLDQAALRAVSHWKFQPGSLGNIPVESTVIVPIRFRLEK